MRLKHDDFIENNIFHLYCRCVDSEHLFRDDIDFMIFTEILQKNLNQFPAEIIAFCLMPTHYHITLMQTTEEPVFILINNLLNSYVKKYNKRHLRRGSLMGEKLNHKIVDSDEYLITLCHYIHANPVKSDLVENPESWPYSNYREWIGDKNCSQFINDIRNQYYKSPMDYKIATNEYIEENFKQQIQNMQNPNDPGRLLGY